ncbi:MAG: ATP synthase F0 subunit B [Deltaproteobacteria bacterium]|nr:ATP synthase F0 subunit B [Deltaproteobacteria bacterium]
MRNLRGTGRSGTDHQEQRPARTVACRGRVSVCLISCLVLGLFWLTAAYASGGGGAEAKEGPNWLDFLWRSFNFAALIGILFWLVAKKAKAFFAGRREGIEKALEEAVTAREAAEKKFQEYAAKLDKATGEIDQIGGMIEAQGQTEKARIIADARKTAEKIKEDTQARMDQEFAKASQELRTEAVRLSTEMAEALLKKHIQAADHEAMVKDYIEKVVTKN